MADRYAVAAGNWNSIGTWSTTSGGSPGASFPTSADDAYFDAASGAINVAVNVASACHSILMRGFGGASNFTGTLSGSNTLAINLNCVLSGSMTLSYNGTITFTGGGAQALTTNGKTFLGPIILNSVGGTLQPQDNIVSSSTFTLTAGTFDAASTQPQITFTTVSISGATTRTMLTGSGTWTLTGTGNVWDATTTTNLTYTSNSGFFLITDISSSTKTFAGGGLTYRNITFSGASVGAWVISGASTVFTGNTVATGGQTLDIFGSANMVHGNVDLSTFSGFTSWTNAGTIRGNLTLNANMGFFIGVAVTFTNAGFTTFNITMAGKTWTGAALTFVGGSGSWNLVDALSTASTITLTSGTLIANSNVTCTAFSSANTNTRVIKMGPGTWTLTGTGTVWDTSTVTGLTVTPQASTIVINNASSSAKTFAGGGKTFYNIYLTGAGTGTFDFTGSNAFNDFKCDTPPHTVRFTGSTTTTVNTFTVAGASGNLISLTAISGTFTLTKSGGGVVACPYLSVTSSTASSVSTWYAIASTDGGGNTAWTFAAPGSASPRIYFNSHWVDFPYLEYRIQDDPAYSNLRNKAASGVVETLNINVDNILNIAWRWFVNADTNNAALKRHLRQWFLWAQQGNAWALALDNAETVLTTVAAAAAIGDLTLTLASAAGVIVDKSYVVRSATRFDFVKVASISGAVVTLYDPLNFTFAIGDRFRSEQYWPARLITNANPIVEQPPLHYDFNLQFMEDVNSL